MRESGSLGAMLQKDSKNEVPESVLAQLPPEDRVLVENILLVAQAELEILNLASTTVVASESIVRVSCALAGPSPLVALSNMRCVQAYSPARVRDVAPSSRKTDSCSSSTSTTATRASRPVRSTWCG